MLQVQQLRDEVSANSSQTSVEVTWEHFGEDQAFAPEMYAVYGFRLTSRLAGTPDMESDRTATVTVQYVDGVGWRVSDLDPFPIRR